FRSVAPASFGHRSSLEDLTRGARSGVRGHVLRCIRVNLGGGMEKVDYDARLHAVYAAGRQMSPDALQTWMEAFARHLPETRPLVWLDLGSGTGRMTPSLATAFGGPVHGVEPSDRMRAQALVQ